MSIYLIRHGQTDLNAARVVQHPHTPLSEVGLEQARRVGERMRADPIALVLRLGFALRLAKRGYRFLSANRYKISRRPSCDSGECAPPRQQ